MGLIKNIQDGYDKVRMQDEINQLFQQTEDVMKEKKLIVLSVINQKKVLVFCQYIKSLEIIKDQLIKLFDQTEEKEELKMDEKIPTNNRHPVIDVFNDLTSEERVILASTKEYSEELGLVGASSSN